MKLCRYQPHQIVMTASDIAIQMMWKGVQPNDVFWMKPAANTIMLGCAVVWQPVTLVAHLFFILFNCKLGWLSTPSLFWSALGIWYFLGAKFHYMPKTTQVAWVKVELWTQMRKHRPFLRFETDDGPCNIWVLPEVDFWTFHHQRMNWKYSSACCSCKKGKTVRRACILRKSESPESPSNTWSKRIWDSQAGHCFVFFTQRWENAYVKQVCAKQCL